MLTSMFYYGHYRPYILKTSVPGKAETPKRAKIAEPSNGAENFKVLMNKALKTDVVEYARGVSTSVVGTKEASKNLMRDMTDFNKNIYGRGVETARRWIKYDLDEFANSYNTSVMFLANQKHSQALRGFSERTQDAVAHGVENLENLGLKLNDSGSLKFDGSYFDSLSEAELNMAIGENVNTFQEIYNDASHILTEPLKEHMQFKSLNYYYNYKLGIVENDTFKMIESGMMIDKVV